MKGPFRRSAESGDERMQRRLRELAERAERPERPLPPIAPPSSLPPPVPAPPYVPPSQPHVPPAPTPPPVYAPPAAVTYAAPALPPFAIAPPPVAPRRRVRWVLVVAAVLCLCVVLAVVRRIESTGPQGWTSEAATSNGLPDWPPAPAGAGSAPLGRPPTDVPDADTYLFLHTQEGSDEPVTYDPCAPIHYVVNDRTAFGGALEELDAAVAEVEKATGLDFVNDGPTEEAPILERAFLEKRYGKSWSPVLVAWSDEHEYDGLDGNVVGRGGSQGIRQGGRSWYVTGSAVFDGPQLRRIYRGPDGPAQVRTIIMHELGHVVGLHHVSDRGEIMKPAASRKTTTWGPGDRAGLALLGAGNCITY